MTRSVLFAAWLVLGGVPLGWFLLRQRRVDPWRALPVPAALLGRDGKPVATTGPPLELASLTPTSGLPARGRVARTRAADGTPLAVSGVRRGGLAVALPVDPVTERRDRVLAELGARLAHDINTPLAALYGHLDLIAHEPISDEARQSVRTCQRELTRLQATASDLLAFTRLRAGGASRSPQLAGALLEEAAAALVDRADQLDATMHVEVPNERVMVDVAEPDVVRALRNLIANALTHGLGERRVVRASVDADEDSVTFSVADSGPGMPPDELRRLSEPLVRGNETTGIGSGLGLAIVSEVLAAHGSSLEVRPAEDGGAVLSFALPRA